MMDQVIRNTLPNVVTKSLPLHCYRLFANRNTACLICTVRSGSTSCWVQDESTIDDKDEIPYLVAYDSTPNLLLLYLPGTLPFDVHQLTDRSP